MNNDFLIDKKLEKHINRFNPNLINFEFGKCVKLNQNDQIEEIKQILTKVPFDHSPDCPMEHIYLNKSVTE
jgi:hypothetical protein